MDREIVCKMVDALVACDPAPWCFQMPTTAAMRSKLLLNSTIPEGVIGLILSEDRTRYGGGPGCQRIFSEVFGGQHWLVNMRLELDA